MGIHTILPMFQSSTSILVRFLLNIPFPLSAFASISAEWLMRLLWSAVVVTEVTMRLSMLEFIATVNLRIALISIII